MKFQLAKKDLNDKVKTIDLEDMIAQSEQNGSAVFYLERENSLEEIKKACQKLEKKSKSIHFNELRYGLDKDSFLYELHIINY